VDAKTCTVRAKILGRTLAYKAGTKAYSVINLH